MVSAISKSNLRWYEYVWACLPIALLGIGGAIGGACGAAVVPLNMKLMGSQRKTWRKFALTGALSLISLGAYFLIARLFLSLTGLGDEMSAERADRDMAAIPTLVAIHKADPKAYDAIRSTVLDGSRQRRPQPEIDAAVKSSVGAVAKRYLPIASDAAVISFTQVITLEIDQIGAKNADRCVDFLYPGPGKPAVDISSFVTPEVIRADGTATVSVIESGSATPQPIPTKEAVSAALGRAVRQLVEKFGSEDVAALSKPASISHDHLCTMVSSLYKNVLSLPTTESGPVLRFLYSEHNGA
jgi:hypothetical protein